MLLGDVKSKHTQRLALNMELDKLTIDFVKFLNQNIQEHPGSCELSFVITDDENERRTGMRTTSGKVLINDDLIDYLQENDFIKYKVEVS